jgi:hypothetical protein
MAIKIYVDKTKLDSYTNLSISDSSNLLKKGYDFIPIYLIQNPEKISKEDLDREQELPQNKWKKYDIIIR